METLPNEKMLERAMQLHIVAHVANLMALYENDEQLHAAAVSLRTKANALAAIGLSTQREQAAV